MAHCFGLYAKDGRFVCWLKRKDVKYYEKQGQIKAIGPKHYEQVSALRAQAKTTWVGNYESFTTRNSYQPGESAKRREAREANADGFHTDTQWLARVEFYGWRCKYCDCKLMKQTLTKDHIIALANGGSHWPSNLAPACRPCNSWKRDKDVRVLGS